jgi:hypothetical protein
MKIPPKELEQAIKDFMDVEMKPTTEREKYLCVHSYIAGFRLADFLEEAKKVDATYPTQELEGYLHDNYIKKEAHFPLSEPKTIYISKENHKEVSLERIKEIYNQQFKKIKL